MTINNTSGFTTAAVNVPTRRLFAPYFRARWQNMQNIVNDTVFYAMAPSRFLNYYQTYVQQWLNWASGYVPQLHRQDFFSTGIGYTVCDIFARECLSGGWRIDSKDDVTDKFFEEWAKQRLKTTFSEMFFMSNAGGNAVLCLTPINGDVYPSVIPVNRIFFDIGRNGKISRACIYNRFSIGSTNAGYYARETRLIDNGKAYYIVELSQSGGLATTPTWGRRGATLIPPEIRVQWEYSYGDIMPGVWYEMPKAIGIGLYNVKNKAVSAALVDLPGYADSSLHTALDVLYSIDYNYTMQQLDMYWGRTRVLMPKEMQPKAVISEYGQPILDPINNLEAAADTKTALADDIYCKVYDNNAIDGKPIQPEFIQPDLRGEAHRYIRDADLELLASKVGLSSSTLANHLQSNSVYQDKTATEVNSEQDTTAISVNNKRELASIAINEMLSAVANFYGFKTDVIITWNRYGINSVTENQSLLADYQAGTIPKREYIQRRFSNLTSKQLDEWINALALETPPNISMFSQGGY